MPSWVRVWADDGPFTSGSFKIQSALSATVPRTWAMLQLPEMKGDLVCYLSRAESACKSIALCDDA
jgi:hypothetical protein